MSPLRAPHIMPRSHVVDVARLLVRNLRPNLETDDERYLEGNLKDNAVRFIRDRVLQASSQLGLPKANGRVVHPIFPQDRDIQPPNLSVLENRAFPSTADGLGITGSFVPRLGGHLYGMGVSSLALLLHVRDLLLTADADLLPSVLHQDFITRFAERYNIWGNRFNRQHLWYDEGLLKRIIERLEGTFDPNDTKIILSESLQPDSHETITTVSMVGEMVETVFNSKTLDFEFNDDDLGDPILEEGLVFWDEEDPAMLAFVRPNKFVASEYSTDSRGRVNQVVFSAPLGRRHIEFTRLISNNNRINPVNIKTGRTRLESRLRRYVNLLKRKDVDLKTLDAKELMDGALQVGFEYEFWAIDPETGELEKIPHKELLMGLIEIDQGKYVSPLDAAAHMAQIHLNIIHAYGDKLVVSQSTPPSSNPMNTEVNYYGDSRAGRYIAQTLPHLMTEYGPSEDPQDPSRQIRDQQAMHIGKQHFEDMVEALSQDQDDEEGKNRHAVAALHAIAAAHMNMGLPHVYFENQGFLVDFEVARNTSNLAFSKLGSIVRMLTASNPFLTGRAMNVDGHTVRDVREFIRNDAGTALPQNEPIRDAKHFKEIVAIMPSA